MQRAKVITNTRVRRNQNKPVPSDPFRTYSNLRKYDKIISELRVSFFVHQAAGEEREGREGVQRSRRVRPLSRRLLELD